MECVEDYAESGLAAIERLREGMGLSEYRLAKLCGVDRSVFAHMKRRRAPVSREMVERVISGLALSYRQANLLRQACGYAPKTYRRRSRKEMRDAA